MRVKIGSYTNWFGPSQLAEKLCFWAKEVPDEYGILNKPNWVDNFGEWLAHGSVEPDPEVGHDFHTTWLYKFLLWIDSKKERTIKVHIDRWDTWSMDETLAHIILPMLIQLKETTHGAPYVDDKDVPKHLRGTTDEFHFERWDWVLDEMIFAFESKNEEWEDQFYSGERDLIYAQQEDGFVKIEHGPNHTLEVDKVGREEYQKRITNGFRLFGKYYENLWD
jgi:hypothetical protein